VVVSDGAGSITQASLISTTELNQLDGINTGQTIQAQINGKQNIITGAATSITNVDLLSNRALASTGAGKVGVSNTTLNELNQLVGVSTVETVQDQIDARLVYSGGSPSDGDSVLLTINLSLNCLSSVNSI
jgi:hypothetical protein